MTENHYLVTFDTKKGGDKRWAINITAGNAKVARQKALEMWYNTHQDHMFHVSCRRLREDEELLYNWFVRV